MALPKQEGKKIFGCDHGFKNRTVFEVKMKRRNSATMSLTQTTILFFHPIQIHSHIFFPSILAMALPQTMYFFLFLFLFTALQNKNIVLVFRIYVLFFCFCLHHFIIRILYLSLQHVNQNKNTVLEITLSVYQGTFTIIERDKLNCFGERLTICVHFFYISPLFQQCHCYKSIATIFFPSYFGNAIATNPFHNFFFFFLKK